MAVSMDVLMADLVQLKYNPAGIQQRFLDLVEQSTQGGGVITSGANAFVMLLGMAAAGCATSVLEAESLTRDTYASLAVTPEALYRHMSDTDYLGRFGSPCSATFRFMLSKNKIIQNAVPTGLPGISKVTIPRNTYVTVAGMPFALEYPIDISVYLDGLVRVAYDTTYTSPLVGLTTNIISHSIDRSRDGLDWITFDVPMLQVDLKPSYFTIMPAMYNVQDIALQNDYYYARGFYQTDVSGPWIECAVTHSQDVFDALKPTLLLSLMGSTLRVTIPPVYVDSGLVSGNLRVDVYTTKGYVKTSLGDYKLDAFVTTLYAVDEPRDITPYSIAMSNVDYTVVSGDTIDGGVAAITFDALRARVINNSYGSPKTPITSYQLANLANNLGYTISRYADTVTDRVFGVNKFLPKPSNPKLVTSGALTIEALTTTVTDFANMAVTKQHLNGSMTLLPGTLYTNASGSLKLVDKQSVKTLWGLQSAARVAAVNNGSYLFNPLYYVIEPTKAGLNLRPYIMNRPVAKDLGFVSNNVTTGIIVNTGKYVLTYNANGYSLIVETTSNDAFKALDNNNIHVQLAYTPVGESVRAYLNGVYIGDSATKEKTYRFDITTDYDIDALSNLALTGFQIYNSGVLYTQTPLTGAFDIIYTTDVKLPNYQPDVYDVVKGGFLLPDNSVVITTERITLKFGSYLKYLWSRARNSLNANVYQTYDADVPSTYTQDVYQLDPTTGFPFTVVNGVVNQLPLLHTAGSPKLNPDGSVIYIHRKGDPKLDANGFRIPAAVDATVMDFDILLMESPYVFATAPEYGLYVNEVLDLLETWINNDLSTINGALLEKTIAYFYTKREIGNVVVLTHDGLTATIEARQSFTVDYYVSNLTLNNQLLKDTIVTKTVAALDAAIKQKTVSISNIVETLKSTMGSSIVSVRVSGLGGNNNYELVTLSNDHDSLSLKKILNQLVDGNIIVTEDVTVNFYSHQI